jgi:hypothetical protein
MLTRDVCKAKRSRSGTLSGFRIINKIIWLSNRIQGAGVDVAESPAPSSNHFCRSLHICHRLETKTTLKTVKIKLSETKVCDSANQDILIERHCSKHELRRSEKGNKESMRPTRESMVLYLNILRNLDKY